MREIKFRAWDKQNNRFGPVFMSMHGELFIDRDPYGVDMSGIRKISMLDPDKCIASQFTGLFDKNGKEIYEGDIIKAFIDFGPAGEVEVTYVVEISPFGVNIQKWNYDEGKLPEVLGNIHENPELL